MSIAVKRVYEPALPQDGHRILVDRLWPRGLTKERIKMDEWLKEIAPSDSLRKSYHSSEISWEEFERRYLLELDEHREELKAFLDRYQKDHLTLLFSSKDEKKNNATILKQYLMKLEMD